MCSLSQIKCWLFVVLASIWTISPANQSADTVKPSGSTSFPADGSTVFSGTHDLSGFADDESGIRRVRVRVQLYATIEPMYWNGEDWQTTITDVDAILEDNGSVWKLPAVNFHTVGKYRIRLIVHDNASNVSYALQNPKTEFVVAYDDEIKPVVSFTSPENDSRILLGQVDITGNVIENNSGLNSVKVRVHQPGTPAQYWTSTGWGTEPTYNIVEFNNDNSWTLPNVNLNEPGLYRIRVIASDNAGNISHAIENPYLDIYGVHTDDVKPVASVTYPEHSSEITEGVIDVSGTYLEEDSGIEEIKVRIHRSGSQPQYWDGEGWSNQSHYLNADINPNGTWSLPNVDISGMGLHQIRLVASDVAGNISFAVDNALTQFTVLPDDVDYPNIVLIISDDQGWDDYGFMGNTSVSTPHLDQLASESLLFTRGYVPTSACRPSLATMITGLYPHEHGITGNDPPGDGSAEDRLDPVTRAMMVEIFRNNLTLPEYLANHGYMSFQSGKWWEGSPLEHGFQEGMTHGVVGEGGRHGDLGLRIGRHGMTDVFDFLDRQTNNPFFLWYAPYMPHLPHTPPDEILEKYVSDERPLTVSKYLAMVEWFDQTVGELLQKLDELGKRENTLVVYVSDNGWVQSEEDGVELIQETRSKNSPYDAGIRSPIMFRWPDQILPARDDTTLVGSVDLVPTILTALGLETSDSMRGINVLDSSNTSDREALYGALFSNEAQDIHNPIANLKYRYMMRDDGWKLILPYLPNRDVPLNVRRQPPRWTSEEPELYNVINDPAETTDFADTRPDLLQEMTDSLNLWWETYD